MNNIELKSFREKYNLTQQEVADMVKKTVRAVQSWEQGVRNMPQSVVLILENYERKIIGDSEDNTKNGNKEKDKPFEDWKIDDKLNEIYKFQLAKLTIMDKDVRLLNRTVDEISEELATMKADRIEMKAMILEMKSLLLESLKVKV